MMNIQEMDGTAFDLARKAIEQLAKEKISGKYKLF